MNIFTKDPQATLDYSVDWTEYLGADDIVSSSFTNDVGVNITSPSNTLKTSQVWVSGGTIGLKYKIINSITTTGGRTDERSFFIRIANK